MTQRYFGIDVHKVFLMITAVKAQQEILQPPLRVAISEAPVWAAKTLTHDDKVVLEVNPERLELSTNGLKVRCSTIELRVRGCEGIIAIVDVVSNGQFSGARDLHN